jgi:hypothetical protein
MKLRAFCFLVFSAASLLAQEAVPQPPLLAAAPAVSRWTIATEAPAAESGATARGPVLTVCKSGGHRLEVTVTPQGTRSESFVVKGLSFQKRAGFAPGDIYVESAVAGDFPEFAWVKAENFIGTKSESGKKYHVYAWTPASMVMETTGASRQVAPAQMGAQGGKTIEAWIDAETRLPVRLVHPTFRKVYTFAKSSPSDALPSAEIRARVESYFGGKLPE